MQMRFLTLGMLYSKRSSEKLPGGHECLMSMSMCKYIINGGIAGWMSRIFVVLNLCENDV